MRKLTSVIVGLVALAVVSASGLILIAPHVLVLAQEGFPAPMWPANGDFVAVAGRPTIERGAPNNSLPPEAMQRFENAGGKALLVEQDGIQRFEQYAANVSRETKLNSYSMVKSLVGLLVLKAHGDGLISDLDASIEIENLPNVTWRQALTMTSGLELSGEWPKSKEGTIDDGTFNPFSAFGQLHARGPEILLGNLSVSPMLRGVFRYQSANTAILGVALEALHGRPLNAILASEIWQPAGASDALWRTYPGSEQVTSYCCLYARAYDWLLVGRFIMDNGSPEEPLLPLSLWNEFVLPELGSGIRRSGAYGFHLRHDVLDRKGQNISGPFAYFMGHGGQTIYLLPHQDAVVVRFGDQPQLLHSTLYELIGRDSS